MADAASVGSRAASGALYVGMAQIFRIGLTTLSAIVIARILSPGDYGVIAMVAPVTAFIVFFQDLGLSQATVQARTISRAESSALFWLNIFASLGCAAALVLLSPLVGLFYHDFRPAYVSAASAINIVVAGAALQHSALMTRNLEFAKLAGIDMTNGAVAFLVTVVAALMFRSYWALWIGTLAGVAAGTLLTLTLSKMTPEWPPRIRGIGSMARFGGNVTGFNLVNFFVRNLDNVLIARVSGAAELGLYDRSYKLMMLPIQNVNSPLARIMVPMLSRSRDDPVAYRRAFLVSVRAMMLITLPGIAVSVALSRDLMTILLGPRWVGAAPIFFWLSLTGLVQPLSNATGWLFISSGRAREQFHWGLFSAVVTLAGFGIGVVYAGAVGVAASLFITAVARVPLLYPYCRRGTSVTTWDLYRSMAEPLAGGLIAIAAIKAASTALAPVSLLITGMILAYFVTILLFLANASGRDLLKTLRRHIVSGLATALSRSKSGKRDAALQG